MGHRKGDSMKDLLSSTDALIVVATVIGALWTFFRSTAWYQERVQGRRAECILAIAAAVHATYEEFVRYKKLDHDKLTNNERAEAQRMAMNSAVEHGIARGLDIVREFGEDAVRFMINQEAADQKLSKGAE